MYLECFHFSKVFRNFHTFASRGRRARGQDRVARGSTEQERGSLAELRGLACARR